ncbi:MAG: phage tail tape measure protein [Magnetospirillum sp.]|nr:phage tail tape measure protein [Magnetospirillum sp.]
MSELALSLVIGATVGAGLRAAVGTTIAQVGRLGQAVQEAERQKADALKATARVEQTERQLKGYRTLGMEVLAAGRAHREAQDKVRGLAREIAASEEPTKAQEKALEAARRAVERAAAAEAAKKQRLASLRAELKAAGIDTRDLAGAERKLAADMAEAKAKVDQTTQSIGRLGDAMERANKRRELGGQFVGEALKIGAAFAAIRQPVKAEGDFEHQLRAFGNTAGMTADELEKVRAQVRGMSTEVIQSNSALLSGVEVLVGKGMEAKQALAAIKDIGRAATATGASIDDMANLSFSVMSNLHVPVDKLGKALDIMAQAGKEGGFELKHMAQQFPQLTAAAASLGLTGTEAVASLGAALQVAMKGASDPSTAANNLANFLGKIASPETVRNFSKLGIDIKQALADGAAAGENPLEVVMKEIATATGADLDKAMADAFDANGKLVEGAAEKISERFKLGELFGDKQVQDFLAPMLGNYQEYLKIKQKAAGAGGVVDKDFANMASTFNDSSKKLGLAWDKLMGSIGKALLPVVTPLVNGLATGVDALANLADAAPHATAALVGLVGVMVTYKAVAIAGRYALTFYRSGLGGVVREMLNVGRASAPAAAGAGRVAASSAGMGSRLGAAILRLRQYTAAANSAAGASNRLAGAQGGVGGLGGLGGAGKLGRALRFGGKALGGAGLLLGAGMAVSDLMDPNLSKEEKGGAAGNLAGGLAGAAAGAAIGSFVPVIGTALGAIIGGTLGAFGGEKLGGWLAKYKTPAPPTGPEPPLGNSAAPAGGGGSAAAAATPKAQQEAGGTYIFNIYQQPGEDARALADRVARLLQERQRAALHD